MALEKARSMRKTDLTDSEEPVEQLPAERVERVQEVLIPAAGPE